MQNRTVSHTSQIPNLSPNDFDYTFTDRELQDILGFMEHQAGGPDAIHTSAPPSFLAAPPASVLGLQFQPHAAPVQSGSTLAVHPYDPPSTPGVTGDVASSSSGLALAPVLAGVNDPMARGHTRTRSGASPAATNVMNQADRHLQQIQGTATNRQDRGQPIAKSDTPFLLLLLTPIWVHASFCFAGLQSHGKTSVTARSKSSAETESTH